jgi:hypothetical protein
MLAAVYAVTACAPQPPPRPRPEILPGEVLVHTADASLLTTEKLSAATRRQDFAVKEVHCLLSTCRIVVERIDGAADSNWTYGLVDALAAAHVPGIADVTANRVVGAH